MGWCRRSRVAHIVISRLISRFPRRAGGREETDPPVGGTRDAGLAEGRGLGNEEAGTAGREAISQAT